MKRTVVYVGGYDTAAAQKERSDSAACSILRAALRTGVDPEVQRQPADFELSFVYARTLRNQSARQQAGLIHLLQDRFGCSSWLLDGGGGGLFVARELRSQVQLIEGVEATRVPLITRDDRDAPVGRGIVSIFRPKDSGISSLWPTVETSDGINDFMHKEMSGALEAGLIAEPPPLGEIPKEILATLSEEAKWSLRILDAGRKELLAIGVSAHQDGTEIRTKNGFRQFVARGRKDIAYSKIYAYVAFLIWLSLGSAGGGASEMGDGVVGD
jgi:hypothetical protein